MTKIKRELEDGEIATSDEEEHRYFSSAAARIAQFRNYAAQKNLEEFAMANCSALETAKTADESGRVYTCKTCHKDFPSFQALGGHRASHKRLQRIVVTTIAGEYIGILPGIRVGSGFKSRRLHRCSICGREFEMGQALGGHMRRHRSEELGGSSECTSETTTLDMPVAVAATSGGASESGGGSSSPPSTEKMFDLNLTPYENYRKFFD